MSLPNPGMDFVPFDILTAGEMDDLVENIESLAGGTGFNTGVIPTAALADGAVTSPKAAAGFAVQVVGTTSSALATGSTIIPSDDTIPQNTEGTEFMTLGITPKSATNKLLIQVVAFTSVATADRWNTGALFQDSIANALAVNGQYMATSTGGTILVINHVMTAGTTSPTTFKFRAGPHNTGTITLNGTNGTRLWGAITKSSMTITEYKA